MNRDNSPRRKARLRRSGPLIIFDLDGTLADSKRDLCASVNYVRRRFGLGPLDEHQIASMIGEGATRLIQQALAPARARSAAPDRDIFQEGLEEFLAYYREHMLDQTRLYPGVGETLEALGDCELAVLTNKPYRFSCRMLEGLGIYDRFSVVYGGNSFSEKKPDPVGVFQILADTGSSAGDAWIVGDSAVDVKTGRAAGIRTCGVRYGYAPETFRDDPPDFVIDTLPELEPLVRRNIE